MTMPIIFAPSAYKQPQRRNPELVDAKKLSRAIEEQIKQFRRNN